MSILDPATVLALAIQCAPVAVDPHLILSIARTESGLDPSAVHVNANGTRDVGLMQVNTANWSWLGLNEQTALDPCQSISAGVRVLTALSAYNTGRPTAGISNGYVGRVLSTYHAPLSPHRGPRSAAPVTLTLSDQFLSPN